MGSGGHVGPCQVPRRLEGLGPFQHQWPCLDDFVRHPDHRFVAALAMRLKPQRNVDDADAARGHLLQFRRAHHAHASLCARNHHAPWISLDVKWFQKVSSHQRIGSRSQIILMMVRVSVLVLLLLYFLFIIFLSCSPFSFPYYFLLLPRCQSAADCRWPQGTLCPCWLSPSKRQ